MRTLLLTSTLLVACGSSADPAPPPPVAPTPAPAPAAAPAPAPTPPPAAAAAPAVADGVAVLVNYHGLGFYYVGVITAVTGDQISILYADGDTETVTAAMTRPDTLAAGTRGGVLEGDAYVPCTIETRRGHALGLVMGDGTRRWASIGFVRVAEADIPSAAAAPAGPAPAFGEPGSIVLAQYSGDNFWYEAVVGEAVGDGRRVVYADGSSEDRPMTALRSGGIAPGARVEARDPRSGTVGAGSVLRRIEHGVLVQLDGGAPTWFSLGNVRLPS